MFKGILYISTLAAAAGLCLVLLNPVHSRFLNLAFLLCLLGVWFGLTTLAWRHRVFRLAALSLPFILGLPFMLPGADPDPEALREAYVQRLRAFEGTEYVWGGESSRGIDCSGLPRRAFRDALLAYGTKHFNGRALRIFMEHWWFDASARALGEGYRNYTIPLEPNGTIQEMDHTELIPGDLAVTTSGIHLLVYAGGGKWTQADPGIGTVITLDGHRDENSWFNEPVTTHRWTLLVADKNPAK